MFFWYRIISSHVWLLILKATLYKQKHHKVFYFILLFLFNFFFKAFEGPLSCTLYWIMEAKFCNINSKFNPWTNTNQQKYHPWWIDDVCVRLWKDRGFCPLLTFCPLLKAKSKRQKSDHMEVCVHFHSITIIRSIYLHDRRNWCNLGGFGIDSYWWMHYTLCCINYYTQFCVFTFPWNPLGSIL